MNIAASPVSYLRASLLSLLIALFASLTLATTALAAPSFSDVSSSGSGNLTVTGVDLLSLVKIRASVNGPSTINYYRPGTTAGSNPLGLNIVWSNTSIVITADDRIRGRLIRGVGGSPAPPFSFQSFWTGPGPVTLTKPSPTRIRIAGKGLRYIPYIYLKRSGDAPIRIARSATNPPGMTIISWTDDEIIIEDPSFLGVVTEIVFSDDPDDNAPGMGGTVLDEPVDITPVAQFSAYSSGPDQVTITGADFTDVMDVALYGDDGSLLPNYTNLYTEAFKSGAPCAPNPMRYLNEAPLSVSSSQIVMTAESLGGITPAFVSMYDCNGDTLYEGALDYTGLAPAKSSFSCPTGHGDIVPFIKDSSPLDGVTPALGNFVMFDTATCTDLSPIADSAGYDYFGGFIANPSGTKYAFFAKETDLPNIKAYVVDSDGSNMVQIAGVLNGSNAFNSITAEESRFAWKDDDTLYVVGNTVGHTSPIRTGNDIWRVDLGAANAQSGLIRLTTSGGHNEDKHSLAYSGNYLYYISDVVGYDTVADTYHDIKRIDATTSTPTETVVVDDDFGNNFYGIYVTGDTLLVQGFEPGSFPISASIWPLDLSLSLPQLSSTMSPMINDVTSQTPFRANPAGTKIIWLDSLGAVKKANLDGSGEVTIYTPANSYPAYDYSWSADGLALYSTCRYSEAAIDICQLDPNGSSSQTPLRLSKNVNSIDYGTFYASIMYYPAITS